MVSDDDVNDMAQTSYGYGCWNASAWFIGPEQGMGRNEDLSMRVKAWIDSGRRELDDCRAYHLKIQEYRWHEDKVRIQSTWGKLMLLYLAFAEPETTDRRKFQKEKWGCQPGDTCVIELSGLAAHNAKVNRDRATFLGKRLEHIEQRMLAHKPRIVVLYGRSNASETAWKKLTEDSVEVEADSRIAEIRRRASSFLAWMPHPVAHGQTNDNWSTLGSKLRSLAQQP